MVKGENQPQIKMGYVIIFSKRMRDIIQEIIEH